MRRRSDEPCPTGKVKRGAGSRQVGLGSFELLNSLWEGVGA